MNRAVPLRSQVAAALVAVVALVLTACGSDTETSGDVPAKTIGVWQSQASGDGQKQTLEAIRTAADAVGWKVVVTDSNGDPQAMQSTMQSLVAQRVDAVLAVYLNSGAVTQQLQAADDAGIPVISVGYQSTPSDDIAAEYAPDQAAQAEILLERMAEDLDDGAKIAPLAVSGYYGIDQELTVLAERAPELDLQALKPINVPITDIFGGTTKAGVDVLNANSDLAALFSAGDFGVQALVPSLEQTNRDVPIYSFGAIPAALTFAREGGVTIVTSDGAKAGFLAVDALLDHWINDAEIPKDAGDDGFEYELVDETNAPEGDEVFPLEEFSQPFLDRWAEDYGI